MKKVWVIVIIGLSILMIGCSKVIDEDDIPNEEEIINLIPYDHEVKKGIFGIHMYPNIPYNYGYFDYERIALEFYRLAFDFANNEEARAPNYIHGDVQTWKPLGFWIDQSRVPDEYDPLRTGYMRRSFGFPVYVADGRVLTTGPEAITVIPAVYGASAMGFDMANQVYGDTTYNFVEMTMKYYDTGSSLVHNGGVQGQTFWYDVFPQIMFARLFHLYPDTPFMEEMVLNGADQWLEALPNMERDGVPFYEFIGYNVVLESPTTVGSHIEPPNGGLAFLFYSAYMITGDEKYLDGAKEVLDYFQHYQKNPNYEAMTDYAPYVAAVLNMRHGTEYDVGKFLDFLFEGDSAFRPGWQVMHGTFSGHPVHGLVGQMGQDYAFSMNSFHLATTLGPMVKYDVRYANDFGKYMLNLTSNARVFFPHYLPLNQQSMVDYLPWDPHGAVVYEGFIRSWGGVDALAMGDATTMSIINQPSDLSIYSAVFLGGFAAMIEQTNVPGILKIDLDVNDTFNEFDHDTFLYYNPYGTDKSVQLTAEGRYDVFDLVEKRLLARNVTGTININIPGESARVIAVLPSKTAFTIEDNQIFANEDHIANLMASVNIENLNSRQNIYTDTDIRINYQAPLDDEVIHMEISFNEVIVYSGEPLSVFRYDKSVLPDTDYTLRITVTTRNGLRDSASKRVIAN